MYSLKEAWRTVLSQEAKVLPERSPLNGGERLRVLAILTPLQVPGWSTILYGSSTKKRTLDWLLAKGVFQRLSKEEKELLGYISLDRTNVHSLVDIILSDKSARKRSIRQFGEILQRSLPTFEKLTERYLLNFKPQAQCFKIWTEPIRVAPTRYIGVGYKDHGSLGSAPSWKDQILRDDENSDVNAQVQFLWTLFINTGTVTEPAIHERVA
jgi:hypothetical protein